jgi:glutathione synthase/RimK-type ligase-like ATP-grasp enzyme
MRSGKPRIAIATCAEYEELKVDDRLLGEALEARGAEALSVVWDRDELAWEELDLCLVRSTWDYHDSYPEFIAWTRQVAQATALHNPAEVIAWNSEKTYLRELADAGVPTVPTAWINRGAGANIEEILTREGWEEAVIKPTVDLGAKNLHRVQAGEGKAAEALASVLSRQDAMAQPFLPSLEKEGELSLVYINGAFSHAVRKHPAPGDFRVQSIWGGTFAQATPDAGHLAIANRALAHLNDPPLYARVDLVNDLNDNPALIELELIEPNLYLTTHPSSVERLANAVLQQLS